MNQLHFPVPALAAPLRRGGFVDLAEQFAEFHDRNPGVYDSVVRIAHELKRRGFRHCGIGFIFERLRWMYALQTSGEEYKLNNNYRAYYARLVMSREADLAGFFRVRIQRDPYVSMHRNDVTASLTRESLEHAAGDLRAAIASNAAVGPPLPQKGRLEFNVQIGDLHPVGNPFARVRAACTCQHMDPGKTCQHCLRKMTTGGDDDK